jgi:hypothetical protein
MKNNHMGEIPIKYSSISVTPQINMHFNYPKKIKRVLNIRHE